ncbi:MAG: orotate phosphoribosyltransferase [Bacteroidia bacterium]|nr:orotate phosphoribosyltransferase [Bacteroidia bacterium]
MEEQTAAKVAEFLLQIKAIKLQPDDPFTWASGIKSPIYCDNRISLSYPQIRTFIRQSLVKSIEANFGKPDVIAGVATGGIPQGVLVAEELELPFIYVRPSAKGHGLKNLVEGEVQAGQNCVVIEDLISTGKSCLNAVKSLHKAEVNVKGVAAVFTYGLQVAEKNFKKSKCSLITLCNYDVLLENALAKGYITESAIGELMAWKKDPESWRQ